jgi:hypothetical protein
VNHVIHVVAMVAVASSAFAQGGVTNADLTKLDTSVAQVHQQALVLGRVNPAEAASIEKALNDLRDEVAFLKVKMRREGPVTPAEYADVRDRLELLRVRAFGAGAPAAPAAAPRPLIATTPEAAPPSLGEVGWNQKFFVSAGLGMSFGKQTIKSDLSMPLYDETATIAVTRDITGSRFVDLSGGIKIGSDWGIGANFYMRSANSDATTSASLPDPLVFDAPRAVTGTAKGMVHKETSFSVLFLYDLAINEKLDVMVMAGPSMVRLQHDLIKSATVTETSGAPTVAYVLDPVKRTFISEQLGADVRYWLSKNFGVGGFFRVSFSKAHLSNTQKLTLGGPQVGFGARIRF